MRTTNTTAASTPDVESYLRVHRLLRESAAQLADSMQSPTGVATRRRDRAIVRWYHGYAGEIRCHHHIEDELLFPALKARVATYEQLEQRLDGDHTSLDVVLDELAGALGAGNRELAASLATHLREHLDEHLGFEDDEIVPLFLRHFTAIEFAELNAQAIKMTAPKQLIFTAPWLMASLDAADQRELLAASPKPMGVLWKLTRGRYADDHASVSRHDRWIGLLMSVNREALQSWLDCINRRDLTAIETFVGDDIVDHHLPAGVPAGRAGVVMWCTLLADALEMRIVIEDMVEDDDQIAVRATVSGRHVADFMGMPATDRAFTASMMSIERFADGRIVERWENVDTASIMQQLTG